MPREGLRPCIEQLNPAFAASISTLARADFLKAVCTEYGITYDPSINSVVFAGQLEDQIKAMP